MTDDAAEARGRVAREDEQAHHSRVEQPREPIFGRKALIGAVVTLAALAALIQAIGMVQWAVPG